VSAGLVLPLALIAIAVYLLAPELLVGRRSTSEQMLAVPAVSPVSKPAATAAPTAEAGDGDAAASVELTEQLSLASDLVYQSRFDEAIAIYESMAQQVPKDLGLQIDWAWALLLGGWPEEALDHARRAVELEPLSAEAMSVLAKAYLAAGDTARALGIGQSAVELDDSSSLAHAVLAEAYWVDGQLEQAVDEADLALAKDPNSAAAHRIRGWLYLTADQDGQRAVQEMRLAADQEPELWQRHSDLGRVLLRQGTYDEAVVELERALALHQNSEDHAALAEVHYWLGNYEEAADHLNRARLGNAELPNIDALTAAIWARQDRCGDAQAHYGRELIRDPANQLALEARMVCEGTPTEPAAEPSQTPTPQAEPTPATTGLPPLQGRIAFPVWNVEAQRYDVYVSQTDGSGRQLVLEGAHQPAFSPAGNWLAVNGERHLQENLLVLQPDGSELWEVTEHAEDGRPAWSPDGKSLAFSSTRHGDRQSRVYVVDTVPLDGRKEVGRVLNAGAEDARGAYPSWTSAGQVVYSGCDYARAPAVCGLLQIATQPGQHTPDAVTNDPADIAPAAHGGRVAFMSNREGNWDIYVVDSGSSELLRLTSDPANEGLPVWSPDGRALAYVSDRGGQWAVWVMAPDGTAKRMLFEVGGGGLARDWQQERISWAP
jgi:TolB protein